MRYPGGANASATVPPCYIAKDFEIQPPQHVSTCSLPSQHDQRMSCCLSLQHRCHDSCLTCLASSNAVCGLSRPVTRVAKSSEYCRWSSLWLWGQGRSRQVNSLEIPANCAQSTTTTSVSLQLILEKNLIMFAKQKLTSEPTAQRQKMSGGKWFAKNLNIGPLPLCRASVWVVPSEVAFQNHLLFFCCHCRSNWFEWFDFSFLLQN